MDLNTNLKKYKWNSKTFWEIITKIINILKANLMLKDILRNVKSENKNRR